MTDTAFNPCDPIFKVAAGDGYQTVQVHQSVLCKSSDFFKNVVKPEWCDRRADPYIIDLSDHSLEVVIRYVRWLYGSDVDMEVIVSNKTGVLNDLESKQSVEALYDALVEAYVFGEKIMDATYTRVLLGKMISTNISYNRTPGPIILCKLYDGTAPGDLARRLFTHFVAHGCHIEPEWSGYLEEYPRELLVEVIKKMTTLRKTMTQPWLEGVSFLDKL